MTHIGPKDHFWTYQPYLHFYGSYCDRCGKVKRNLDGEIISHLQALRNIWRHPELARYHGDIREQIVIYTSSQTLARIRA